jgi:hypothetical protein
MGPLTSVGKLLNDLRVDVRLSVDETNEVSLGHSQELQSSGLLHQILPKMVPRRLQFRDTASWLWSSGESRAWKI